MLMRHALKLGVLLLSLASGDVAAEPIVFGQTLPYSGPTSGWSAIGKVQAAYFKMINATGGLGGVSFSSYPLTMRIPRRKR